MLERKRESTHKKGEKHRPPECGINRRWRKKGYTRSRAVTVTDYRKWTTKIKLSTEKITTIIQLRYALSWKEVLYKWRNRQNCRQLDINSVHSSSFKTCIIHNHSHFAIKHPRRPKHFDKLPPAIKIYFVVLYIYIYIYNLINKKYA